MSGSSFPYSWLKYSSMFIFKHGWTLRYTSRFVSPPPLLSNAPTASESASAHTWIASFGRASIPREEVELTFARSSGPGGQNVNKVNTKATVRCTLDKAWIPRWVRPALMRTPAYVSSSRSLLITSTQHRSQSKNVEECLAKLHTLIRDACLASVPTPADPERMARKKGHENAAKERRRTSKLFRAAVKSCRKGSGRGWE